MTQTEPEDQSSALVPVLLSILGGVAAYSAGKNAIGTWADVAEDLRIAPRMAAALGRIAQRALRGILSRTTSPVARAQMTKVIEKAVDIAVQDGIRTVAQAARALARDEVDVRQAGDAWVEKVSPSGEPYSDDTLDAIVKTAVSPDRLKDTARDLAGRTHQTVWNAAEFHAAEQAGWPRKTWHSKNDTRVRPSHAFLGSPKYEYHTVDIGEPFISIDGHALRYPGDPLAPLSETANCRCWMICHK